MSYEIGYNFEKLDQQQTPEIVYGHDTIKP